MAGQMVVKVFAAIRYFLISVLFLNANLALAEIIDLETKAEAHTQFNEILGDAKAPAEQISAHAT
jgi:hypothetical protein